MGHLTTETNKYYGVGTCICSIQLIIKHVQMENKTNATHLKTHKFTNYGDPQCAVLSAEIKAFRNYV
jgi:hypothetical protein